MNYYYLNTGGSSGQYNMDYDIHIAKICKPGEFFLRLYKWEPFCISLGANQDYESINIKRAEKDNIEIVKRPTGGRAILHSEELTYSAVTSTKDQKSTHNFYNEINQAIKTGLIFYDNQLSVIKLESEQANFPKIYKQSEGNVCFASTAKSEIKFKGRKLVGSAQRKLGNNLLQHGSILCGSFHKNLISYLNLPEEKIKNMGNRINNITTDLQSILNKDIDFGRLRNSIKKGFEKHFNISFIEISINYDKEEFVKVYQEL